MIYLYTGSNGSGKTLNSIKFICEELNPEGDRPVFYFSPDTQPIGIQEAGVLDWTSVDSDQLQEWYEFPYGSIFLIDEFRHVWPWRDHKKTIPESVDRLSEHRSKGFDFILTAQKPSAQFDPAIQGFIEEHRHLEGIRGSKRSKHFVYQSFCSSPLNPPKLSVPDVQIHKFDKKYFDYYRSAILHTHRDRLPYKKLIPIALLILGVPALIWFGLSSLSGIAGGSSSSAPEAAKSLTGGVSQAIQPQQYEQEVAMSYFEYRAPRIEGLPHTAPVYDALTAPKTVPMPRGCILVEATGECTCYTQQATRMDVPDGFCKSVVRNGWFDDTREPVSDRPSSMSPSPSSPSS